jgi:hypothetical protein
LKILIIPCIKQKPIKTRIKNQWMKVEVIIKVLLQRNNSNWKTPILRKMSLLTKLWRAKFLLIILALSCKSKICPSKTKCLARKMNFILSCNKRKVFKINLKSVISYRNYKKKLVSNKLMQKFNKNKKNSWFKSMISKGQ